MPTFNQNLNILRNGLQRKKSAQEKDSDNIYLPSRDHYERWTDFSKRQSSKTKQVPWTTLEVINQAVSARRDTALGIIDTITREYITYWVPEIMLFQVLLENEGSSVSATTIQQYKTLISALRYHSLDALTRVDCGGNEAAEQLRSTLAEKAKDQLREIFKHLEHDLTDQKEHQCNPDKFIAAPNTKIQATSKKPVIATGSVSEAGILNSSSIWGADANGISPSQVRDSVAKEMAQVFTEVIGGDHLFLHSQAPLLSSRKRRYSQTRMSPEPDPADNGQVWDSPVPSLKRRKLELKSTETVRLSDKNGNARQSRFEIYGRSPRKRYTVDLTMDASDHENQEDSREGYSSKEEDFGNISPQHPTENSHAQCISM